MLSPYPRPKTLKIIIAAVLILPLVCVFINPQLGALLWVLGLGIAFATSHALHVSAVADAEEREQQLWERAERGRTIYVQLVDDEGDDLPEEVARQRLEEAQLRAGPRETVIGVRQ